MLFSEDEKRRWEEMVEKDLAQEPTWGMQVRRLHEHELANLEEVAAQLKR
jgi:hypothetical protein